MEDHHEKNLIWKEIHSLLNDNKYGKTESFINSIKNLRLTNKLGLYDNIIHKQRAKEIIEKVEVEEMNATVTERVFYLAYRPVIRESVEATKIRIACDVSAKACQTPTSLQTDPQLQNQL